MATFPVINHRGKLHLNVLADVEPFTERAAHGNFGCDYRWNKDYTAYRIMPLMWNDDRSYLNYQCDGLDDQCDGLDDQPKSDYVWAKPEPYVDDGLPF